MMKPKILVKYWAPVVVYALAIFIFSSMPEPIVSIPYLFPHSDKVYHFLEYAVLGFLLIRALSSSRKDIGNFALRLIAVVLAIVYGVSDEIHQYFVPGRNMEFLDLLSDGFGAYIGQLFFRIR